MEKNGISRRSFIMRSGASAVAVGAVAGLSSAPASGSSRSANERLRIGFIGPGGRGSRHVKTLADLRKQGANVELVALAEVYTEQRDKIADFITENTGQKPAKYVDYREMFAKEDLDAVCIGTPDHWHAKQTIDAMNAGIHVYCEKPMTKTVEEAIAVVRTWQKTGKIMQVGVQSTSLPVWDKVRDLLQSGKLGKVLMYQTEFFRNSTWGQWRHYKMEENMTPQTIDWNTWLGVEEGLAEPAPFDRTVYKQWRRFWPFGAGMYTDLFVHRTTSMLRATGLRYPGRVVGSGGIYLEYDGRDVPDVATVVAEFNEGVQGLVTASMCNSQTPIQQLIRGHYGSFVFGNGEQFTGFDFVPEEASITNDKAIKKERIEVTPVVDNTTDAHFSNWLEAIKTNDQGKCNNPPDLGAAAITLVNLGSRSYREGKVFHFDSEKLIVKDGDSSWAKRWEQMSKNRAKPNHIPGWRAGETGSTLEDPPHMKWGGPWIDGNPPSKL